MTDRRKIAATVALLALALSGCGGGSTEDKVGRLMDAPDKFFLFTCEQLEIKAKAALARQKELQQLMAKAETTADGRVVSALAYRSQYTEAVADLNEARRAYAEKDCKPSPVMTKPRG